MMLKENDNLAKYMKREHIVYNQEHWKPKGNEYINMIYSQKNDWKRLKMKE